MNDGREQVLLDREEGLRRFLGNATLYEKILRDFADRYGETPALLAEELRAGRREDAILRVHSVKGVAGTLGAGRLQEAAAALEKALKSPESADAPLMDALLKDFIDCHDATIAAVGAAFAACSSPRPPQQRPQGTRDELSSLLERLHASLSNEEPRPCRELVAALRQKEWPGLPDRIVNDLERMVRGYRLSDARVLLDGVFTERTEERENA